ncbi:MAG: c-type cytochrome [Burkholderiales bacterium]
MIAPLALLFLATAAQIPDSFTNLEVLPRDIARDSLVQIMRGISLSLSVRCQYCHVGGDGVSFEGVDFAKDDDLEKRKARYMLRMVDSLNRAVLPNIPELGRAPLRITCKTCHRGAARPELLTQRLERVRDSLGIEAAVAEYRQLRTDNQFSGRYDFGEWEVNLWAERLARSGHPADAIAVYQLNLEFLGESLSILVALGQLHEDSDRAKALDYYRRALALRPQNPELQRRIQRLETPPR